uniref:Uncharacterized protein n=1 Tax=Neobodo designis TaxID=312471 RepID=A0A7S1W7K2_NEODS|mmetsp:Transcript_6053/g.19117  ORF Transcript_6053/g.19117 Transcript_6053/m.19117 type:complete len:104 (+) Transcript_6053:156-467(+)|eukprot:CAMPEP_0174828550 /NCGR_PEP_ID=MMETSP1114-20130205/1396_1 /TAXON_ID=312471 /ORGANISM="Neobodo designis, Strain CCAP 1951/1" /LENGTH=103 /DNA_ID=CAMNT_0016062271 /DNA_START=156 /DNA_END=467 /DNA_ORIENTATION=+
MFARRRILPGLGFARQYASTGEATSSPRPYLRWTLLLGCAVGASEALSRHVRHTTFESMSMCMEANKTPLWHGDSSTHARKPPSGGNPLTQPAAKKAPHSVSS